MFKKKIQLFITIILLKSLNLFCNTLNSDTSKIGGEYFIKGLCGAIHSIVFDNNGMMYVGSLGDNQNEIRKYGHKKIFKITPSAEWEVYTTVKCTYITGLNFDKSNNLYISTSTIDSANKKEIGAIIKIDSNKKSTMIISNIIPVYDITFDEEFNLYITQDNEHYIITADDYKMSKVSQAESLLLYDKKTIYNKPYGANSIKKYTISQKGVILDSTTIISNLHFSKNMIVDEEKNLIYIIVWNNIDFLYTINMNGEIIDKIKLKISSEFSAHNVGGDIKHVLNRIVLGSTLFGQNYIFGVTWSGDIIKIDIGT